MRGPQITAALAEWLRCGPASAQLEALGFRVITSLAVPPGEVLIVREASPDKPAELLGRIVNVGHQEIHKQ